VRINCSFAAAFAAPVLAELLPGTWGIMQAKINTTAHPNMGLMKQTVQQECDHKVWRYHSKTAACSGCVWRRLSLLAAAIEIISQDNILTHRLKLFLGL
jgi:hypothetical protein